MFYSLTVKLKLDCNMPVVNTAQLEHSSKVNWKAADEHDIDKYLDVSGFLLNKVNVPMNAINCTNCNCTDHCSEIEAFYNSIVDALQIASDKCIPKSVSKHNNEIPGWN